MNHQINIDEAIAIAKEYHLETEVTECIKRGMSPIEALIEWDVIKAGKFIYLVIDKSEDTQN